ncbi:MULTISPECIES: long-chain fatty acid--CoA ligase [Rhodococcus]|uniref:Acyl-CoA synthetase n=1 Tax=Rhodococcus oxybenzonivorans TaxID=1990687 RepID=A0AAE4V1F2_9NOCA|nr:MULTISPECIES: long-chain fatty acid--CoA ligase [Rhodococcus]MDV7245114.1 long-chain fatty acid--CoA ligase [Rhodococcus oxybenzonivorans]MDV7266129.1 long-chain fatty acid--CoA ligase [Rhodococcus oxybenzonivorans]MDV7272603.1 long-chain fatty acid--CoA ligase [Rhodococcus oxybenzonivorans]MDV7336139.1 long-chain fatty acid--CoA ligase [Rhodococcus oxybenzonivorans]MDV7342825.1 long-chain fatty acid--CoA ligase [Rhodococcus oxybenzonivorans]
MREFTSPPTFSVSEHENAVLTVFAHAESTPDRVMYARPEANGWVDVTAKDFAALVTGVAKGLIAHGVRPGDRVALLSSTRFEWSLLDYAIWATGAASVPVYDSSSPDQIRWIIEDSGAVAAVVETPAHASSFEGDGIPYTLKHIFTIDEDAVGTLIKAGRSVDDSEVFKRVVALTAGDLASLVYTSGTTGRPKGCILTHRNFLSEVRALLAAPIGDVARPGNRVLTFLPLAHVLARAVSLAMFEAGATQAHWSDFGTVTGEFERFRPHSILGVPRVFEKVRDGAARKAASGGGLQKRIFDFAETTAVEYSRAQDNGGPGALLALRRAVADKLVYARLRAALGGDCWWAISGGGALMPSLGHFFRGMGVPVYEGYGLTESTAAHCVNVPGAQKIGTVGRPLGGHGVRIAEDGEIELCGDVVFGGYWRNEHATREALHDGWFRTGDLGYLDDEGFLTITGRKKDLLITAGGKNVSPGPLEDRLRSHTLVSQAVVVGDGRPFIGALLTVDPQEFDKWKAAHGRPADASVADLREDEELRAELQDAVDDANTTVSHTESIKRFVILDRDLTEADGELTATLKIKRPVVTERFAADIDALYRRT